MKAQKKPTIAGWAFQVVLHLTYNKLGNLL